MPKTARRKDQSAIDMVTIGTFLSVSCATYQALTLLESIADRGEEMINKAAEHTLSTYEDIKHAGPTYLITGKSQDDEKKRMKEYIDRTLRQWPLGIGRSGGLLK